MAGIITLIPTSRPVSIPLFSARDMTNPMLSRPAPHPTHPNGHSGITLQSQPAAHATSTNDDSGIALQNLDPESTSIQSPSQRPDEPEGPMDAASR
ncbi:hypothetical protein BDV95DRAFT_609027 [Massariosphaeria phaeospora]|uniref:Uncharacterized protein n=1 Tax=Massariosphaeria phaeospora TaxID=100035 RepID=A0A7C8I2Z0_9PLEO|nr:hypothetical protein BDV95DRAFT_609027 [Massariosphaeria phaeospora]